jgi:hypothetical protein
MDLIFARQEMPGTATLPTVSHMYRSDPVNPEGKKVLRNALNVV